ncbi:unnamed protein product [Caenorhabditis sp. 36 PRJEB53466]|nr:unnamed protein product [Caenorhabditis sp. 36 PRJEB53466]
MDTLDRFEENQKEAEPIGPALPPPRAQKTEFLAECDKGYEIINGIPCYQPEHVVDGHIQIFERIGYDDSVGGTFHGLGADGKELVLRVAPADETAHPVRMEAAFLCKVEGAEPNDWRHFSQVHKIFATDDAFHLSLYFRGGPSLEQCFALRNKFTFGTAGRLSNDVLNIIRCAHKHGYLLRNVNPDVFHYDAASRHLFQADISSLIKGVSEGAVANFVGSLDYAPLAHHSDEKVGARHDLESWLYLTLHLVLGELPWASLRRELVGEAKTEFRKSQQFQELPEQFHKIAEIVFSDRVAVAEHEYSLLAELTAQIYTELGGITDHEQNMDFEREPTADEIPRLVMCRDVQLEDVPEENEEEEEEE